MKEYLKQHRIEAVAALVSVLLSLWLLYWDNVINDDGVLYLKSAEAFVAHDWQEAVEIYRWPFYAALIAGAQVVSGLSFDAVAYVLNVASYVILVLAYLAIIRHMGGSKSVLLFAAVFILALPSLNTYRTFVIRDTGFWAFYLLGLFYFFRFRCQPRLALAIGWGASMTVATLFRIEGLVFLIGLPFVELWRPRDWRGALTRFAQLNLVLLLLGTFLIAWFLVNGPDAFTGRLTEPLLWWRIFTDEISVGLAQRADALMQHVLAYHSRDFALSGVLAILALILVTYVVKSLGLLGVGTLAYIAAKRVTPPVEQSARLMAAIVLLNLTILIVFMLPQFFLTGRYVIPLTLVLALLVPFGLQLIYVDWQKHRSEHGRGKWTFPAVVALFLFMTIDSLWSFGVSKDYLKEAGLWLRSEIPDDARLYSESTVVGYYAGKSDEAWRRSQPALTELLKDDGLRHYDYAVVMLKHDEPLPASLGIEQVLRAFSNEKNDRVLIFKPKESARALNTRGKSSEKEQPARRDQVARSRPGQSFDNM